MPPLQQYGEPSKQQRDGSNNRNSNNNSRGTPFLTVNTDIRPHSSSSSPSLISPLSPKSQSITRIESRDSGEVSPLAPAAEPLDLSRISGFPAQFDGFSFGFDSRHRPVSPSGERPPDDPAQLQLPRRASIRPTVASNAMRGGVHREVDDNPDVEPPPPYTKYAAPPAGAHEYFPGRGPVLQDQNPLDPRPRQLSYPAPAHPERVRSGRRGAHQRFASASEAAAGVGGARRGSQRELQPLTLQDIHAGTYFSRRPSELRNEVDLERQRFVAAGRRKRMWRGQWFCPSGGCCGFGQGSGCCTEKGGLSRKNWCIIGAIMILALVAIIVGSVIAGVKASQKSNRSFETVPDAAAVNNTRPTSTTAHFPVIPTGTVTFHPQAAPTRLTTCIKQTELWSCTLPPDNTEFNTTKVDSGSVPDMHFFIEERDNSTDSTSYADTPLPSPVPSTADYSRVASVDGIQSALTEGEETNYYISLDLEAELNSKQALMLPDQFRGQPLRLFDRNLSTEHYGFQIYFQKTIFVDNTTEDHTTDEDQGGAKEADADSRVAWDNTRFSVKIFTNSTGRTFNSEPGGLNLPVQVFEDRVGGDTAQRTVKQMQLADMTTHLLPEIINSSQERGCYCKWSNFEDADGA